MISFFQVFNRGGAVLYTKQLEIDTDAKATDTKDSAAPDAAALAAANAHKPRMDSLVQNVLLEDRASQTTFTHPPYALKWTFENGLDLVFVAVYLNLNPLMYIDELLDQVKEQFVAMFGAELKKAGTAVLPKPPQHYAKFDTKFAELMESYLAREMSRAPKVQRKYEADSSKTLEKANVPQQKNKSKKQIQAEEKKKKKEEEDKAAADAAAAAAAEAEKEAAAIAAAAPAKIIKKPTGRPGVPGPMRKATSKSDNKKEAAPGAAPKKGKELRKWENGRLTSEEAAALDRSADKGADIDIVAATAEFGAVPSREDGDYTAPLVQDGGDDDDPEEDVADEKAAPAKQDQKTGKPAAAPAAGAGAAAAAAAPAPAKVGMLRGLFNSIVGKKVLTREDLAPALESFRQTLMSKNVAAEIAEKLCESVSVSLEGKNLPSFTTIHRTVRHDIEAALTRILTPKKPLDLLQGAMAARDAKRPYTIVFVGVNGVGKSTSLAKVAAYFQSKGFKVGIAACDTFRSGAVEQLRTHALRLNIALFERGYLKEAHMVAADAIAAAKRDGQEVLLIDTAGRMQDNQPLMAALSKLIAVNKPDTVLFVGEALVGNDAVDQVTKFNRCLADLDDSAVPRLIDGLVLTKFDTIDDKVGAAISLTYSTGQPIVFVGTGQTYKDLKRMNAETLIKALLK